MHTEPSPSNPEIQYEKTDAHPRPLYHFLFWICVTSLLAAAFSWGVFAWLKTWRENASQPAVMARPQDGPNAAQPPAPRLQTREVLDLETFRKEEAAILSSYGIVDKEKGVYRIPIEQAMKLAIERGFPMSPEALAAAAAAPAVATPTPVAKPAVEHAPKAAHE